MTTVHRRNSSHSIHLFDQVPETKRFRRSADDVVPHLLVRSTPQPVEVEQVTEKAVIAVELATTPRARRSVYRALQANAEDPILLAEESRFCGSVGLANRPPAPDRLFCHYEGRDLIDNGTAFWSPVRPRSPSTPTPSEPSTPPLTPVASRDERPSTPWAPVVEDTRIPLRGVGADTIWTPRPRQRRRADKVAKSIRFDDVQ